MSNSDNVIVQYVPNMMFPAPMKTTLKVSPAAGALALHIGISIQVRPSLTALNLSIGIKRDGSMEARREPRREPIWEATRDPILQVKAT